MLIKTPELEAELKKKILQLVINPINPTIVGSFGDAKYVTDIDVPDKVGFNERLPSLLYNKIRRLRDFHFVVLNYGSDIRYEKPWAILSPTEFEYDPVKVEAWLLASEAASLFSTETMDELRRILRGKITMKKILDASEIIDDRAKLRWRLEDIIRGYLLVGGKKYSMMEMMKTIKKMVAHYIFPWKDDYIYVDHGIEDYKYKQPKGMVAATEFYQNRYYKILKRFRWDIKAEHKTELMDIVHELSYYNALIKRIDLINKIETYGVFPESEVLRLKKKLDDEAKTNFEWKDYDELEEKLGKKLDREAQKYVEHYFPLLLDNVVTRRYKLYAMNAADNSKQSNLSPKIPVTPPNSPASAKKLSPSSFKSTAKISKGSAKSSAKNSPKNSPKSPNRTSKNSARVSPKN